MHAEILVQKYELCYASLLRRHTCRRLRLGKREQMDLTKTRSPPSQQAFVRVLPQDRICHEPQLQ